MQVLALELDNYSLALQPAARQDDEVVWVPADAFACAAPLDLRRSMEEGFCPFRKGGKTRAGWVSGRCRRCLSCPNSSVASWSPRCLFAAEKPSFICGSCGEGAGGNCQAGSLSMRSTVKRSRSW